VSTVVCVAARFEGSMQFHWSWSH